MPLGFDRELNVVNTNDSAEVYAYIYTERDVPVPQDNLVAVDFTIQRPDGSQVTEAGDIIGPGEGFLRYLETDLKGEYKVVATFTFNSDEKRSVRADFEVIDPFNPPAPTTDQIIAQSVWSKLEDLFDSEEGGPWLQDVTMTTFKKDKIAEFASAALFDINQANPPTDATVGDFIHNGTANANFPLLTQGVLLEVIRHLIRSYVEQPTPTGAQIAWNDRRDYMQRWQAVLQMEELKYMRFVALWKRQFLGLGDSRVLVGSKAGRMIPAPMRTRFVGRGYW